MPWVKQSDTIYQLKVTLDHIRPPIWRRVLVPGELTLNDLHYIIQLSMEWSNSHLHMFERDRVQYTEPSPFDDEDMDMEDDRRIRLEQVFSRPGQKMKYLYDFGDSWEHTILVEKMLPREAAAVYPVCTAGKRAGPPDDCGGAWGYVRLLETLSDPNDPEHEEMMEWAGGPIDPEAFSLEEINKRLNPPPPVKRRATRKE